MFSKQFTDKIHFIEFFKQFPFQNCKVRVEKAAALRKLKYIIRGINKKAKLSDIFCMKSDHLLSVYFSRWRNHSVAIADSKFYRPKVMKYLFWLFRSELEKKKRGEKLMRVRKMNYRIQFINSVKRKIVLKRKAKRVKECLLSEVNRKIFFKKCFEHIKLHPRMVFVPC